MNQCRSSPVFTTHSVEGKLIPFTLYLYTAFYIQCALPEPKTEDPYQRVHKALSYDQREASLSSLLLSTCISRNYTKSCLFLAE